MFFQFLRTFSVVIIAFLAILFAWGWVADVMLGSTTPEEYLSSVVQNVATFNIDKLNTFYSRLKVEIILFFDRMLTDLANR